jgi:hypothetical protein
MKLLLFGFIFDISNRGVAKRYMTIKLEWLHFDQAEIFAAEQVGMERTSQNTDRWLFPFGGRPISASLEVPDSKFLILFSSNFIKLMPIKKATKF